MTEFDYLKHVARLTTGNPNAMTIDFKLSDHDFELIRLIIREELQVAEPFQDKANKLIIR